MNVSRINFHGGGNGAYTWLGDAHPDGSPDVRPLFYGMYFFSESTKGEDSRLAPLISNRVLKGKCETGLFDSSKSVCCSSACGKCGGEGCAEFPGGVDLCCTGKIISRGNICNLSSDVGCILKDATEPLIKGWGVQSGTNEERIIVINKDYHAASTETTIVFQSSYPCRQGRLERLRLSGSEQGNFSAKYGLEYAGQTWDGSKMGELVGEKSWEEVHCTPGQEYTFHVQPGTAAMLKVYD